MGTSKRIWFKEPPIPASAIESVDENVMKDLPPGSKIISIYPHGQTYFTRTAAIVTEQSDGRELKYFIKVLDHYFKVKGEYHGMLALNAAIPQNTARPIAYGTYASDTKLHYLLMEYQDMTDLNPTFDLLHVLVYLHRNTSSPNGRFGMDLPTYANQHVDWTDTWEDFFVKLLRRYMEAENRTHGVNPEMARLAEMLFAKVIPRLIRPLESGGRRIQPCLVHGDLWEGNTSMRKDPYVPVIFDAIALYGHNEYELGPMRPVRHEMRVEYVQEYFRIAPPPFPEDAMDRNLLYCIRFDVVSSAAYPGLLDHRNLVIESMRYLTDKYAGGFEEWAAANPELLDPACTTTTTAISASVRPWDPVFTPDTVIAAAPAGEVAGPSSATSTPVSPTSPTAKSGPSSVITPSAALTPTAPVDASKVNGSRSSTEQARKSESEIPSRRKSVAGSWKRLSRMLGAGGEGGEGR